MGGVRNGKMAGLAATAAAIAALAALPAGAKAAAGPVEDFAYASMTKASDGWPYMGTPLRPGVVGPYVRDSGAGWVRASEGGVPIDVVGGWYDVFHELSQPMRLGVKIAVDGRPLARLLAMARRLKDKPAGCAPAPAPNPCYYDWLMLDHALWISSLKLQRLVRGLKAQGWYVISNDSPWPNTDTRLARGQHGHAHSFGLFDRNDWNRGGRRKVAERIMDPARSVITRADKEFVEKITRRDPNSTPILKFEIHRQTDRLGDLRPLVQRRLLRRLSNAQAVHGFEMSHPVFIAPILDPKRRECLRPGRCRRYNSVGEGTYELQQELMSAG